MEIYSELILKKIELLKKEILLTNYNKDDIRVCFLNMILACLKNYARGYLFLKISKDINTEQLIFPIDALSEKQTELLHSISKSDIDTIIYLSEYHRSLLLSSWSIFELCTTVVCENVLNPCIIDDLLSYQIEDLIRKLDILDTTENRKKLSVKQLTHVPIQRKYVELFKLGTGCYGRNIKDDKKFLEFYRDFRNSQHTNFIFYGHEDKQYVFNKTTFKFRKGKLLTYNVAEPFAPNLYLDLVFELLNIASEIYKAINYTKVIPYPDLDAQKIPL